jgi:hypothetical protein
MKMDNSVFYLLKLCESAGTCVLLAAKDNVGQLVWNDEGSRADSDFSCYKSNQVKINTL